MSSRISSLRRGLVFVIFALVSFSAFWFPAGAGAVGESRSDEDFPGAISDFEARLTLARLLSYRGDTLDEAVREYRILLEERPGDLRLHAELSQVLIRRKEYPEAIRLLQRVLEANPGDRSARTALARVYLWTGRNEEAVKIFEGLGRVRNLPADVLWDMARAYTWQKEYGKAEGIYELLLERPPRAARADLYTELGNVKLYSGRIDSALECYRKALEVDPDARAARKQLALALSWSGREEEALPFLAKLHERDPRDKEIAVALARSLAASGRRAEGTSLLEGLAAQNPRDGELLADLADLEAGAGHAARCRELYLRALDLTEDKELLLLRYAERMNLWGDFYRVESVYRDYLARHPRDSEVAVKLAGVLKSAQRYEEAEAMFLELLSRDLEREKALLGLAEVKLLEKDFQGSLAAAKRLPATDPGNQDALFLQGEALYHAGRYREALWVYQSLARAEPQKARGALAAAKTCLKLGDEESAEPYLEAASRVDPRNVEVRFYRAGPARATSNDFLSTLLEPGRESPADLVEWARVYASLGYNAAAVSCFREALRQDPASFPARLGLAEVLAADHQYEPADRLLEGLGEEFPDASKILITRARVLGWGRQYDRAMEVYDRLCRLNPGDPVPRKEKARTAAWGKKMGTARKVYEESYRIPVDRTLEASLEPLVRGADDPRLTKLFERLRQASRGGSIYRGYEAFYRELAGISGSLPAPVNAGLEQVRLDLLSSYKIQKAAYLERRSKSLAWDRRFTRALDSYRELIEFQPGNQEALFDYAQVECSLGLCDREAATYEKLLAVDPLHLLAGMALKRQQVRSEPLVELNQAYWDEEGRGGLSRITRYRTDLNVDLPLSCRYRLTLGATQWIEDPQTGAKSFDAYGPTLKIRGLLNEYVTAAAAWTNKQYTQGDADSTHTGSVQFRFNLRDYARLGLGYERTDELYNGFGIQQGLQADNFWMEASSYLARNFEVKGRAQYLNYNDGNAGRVYSMVAGYEFTDHPRILKLSVTGEYRDTDREHVFHYVGNDLVDITHPYWTPRDYLGTSAVLEWYHDVSKHFFCGSELHFYDLRVGAGTDTEDNPFFRFEAEWHYEFKDRWVVGIKGLFHRSVQWDAAGAWATLKYRF